MDTCPQHEQLFSDTQVIKEKVLNLDKRINGSIDAIERHIRDGHAWRAGIIGVAVMMIIQSLILASMWGRICRTVEVNSERINELEILFPRTRGERGIQGIQGYAGERCMQILERDFKPE
jgi:hypothetical protein